MLVRSPDASRLRDLITGPDVVVTPGSGGQLEIVGLTAEQIGDLALVHRIAIHELSPKRASPEDAFMELTNDSIEFHGGTTVVPAGSGSVSGAA